ncbi:hypothetical protein ACH49_06910 [Streptomyces leeuwenhoekii]|uniref:Uncharacterized protein n=1 Tax=Streptomyces leeuwenhoekii TaxID=1437453 RepID=A0ABR5I2X7_STRLW|nr:hypothetical protein ACH49_06910 [Streptomyces leeuwenhoekii]
MLQPIERRGCPSQYGRLQQLGELVGIVLGHAGPVGGFLCAGCFVGIPLLASLSLGLGFGGLPGPLAFPGLPRELPCVRIVPARHRFLQLSA